MPDCMNIRFLNNYMNQSMQLRFCREIFTSAGYFNKGYAPFATEGCILLKKKLLSLDHRVIIHIPDSGSVSDSCSFPFSV